MKLPSLQIIYSDIWLFGMFSRMYHVCMRLLGNKCNSAVSLSVMVWLMMYCWSSQWL